MDRPLFQAHALNRETVLFAAILVLAIVSRLYSLGARVMSHDETSHVYFSWLLEQGRGYQHDPITHGPLQFHLIALTYFLLGDSDFTARLPAALAAIAAIGFLWNFRRYLGRSGTMAAALLMLISPYMLYYGRYARNEAYVVLFGVATLWAMLRYLDTGEHRYLYWLTGATVLHFTAKETAFIYTAQAMIFLAIYFLARVILSEWPRPENRSRFLIALAISALLFTGALGVLALNQEAGALSPTETAAPAVPGQESLENGAPLPTAGLALAAAAGIALLVAIGLLLRGFTAPRLRAERSLDMLILLATLVLPMLSPFPVKAIGWDPLDYSTQGMLRTGLFLALLALIALAVGLLWKPRLWLANAALFYSIYVVLYTTVFTNGAGFFTGLVGSLGYWLAQQGVHRGSQPWYYYLFVQVPIYEYLPALGSLLAFLLAFLGLRPSAGKPAFEAGEEALLEREELASQPALEDAPFSHNPGASEAPTRGAASSVLDLVKAETAGLSRNPRALSGERFNAITLLGFWVITSAIAYTYAGEKMPWLTVHITLPMILLAGWGVGHLVDTTDWVVLRARRGLLILSLMALFLVSFAFTLGALLGANPPFQGKELAQLQDTSSFLTSILVTLASAWGLYRLASSWPPAQLGRLVILAVFGLLAVLTARTAITAAYIHYDYATEFLVYAHSGPGPKKILEQIEEISRRTTDGLAIQVAYDDETTYPFWWYLRNFTNTRYFGANPTRDIREAPIILVGAENYGKVEPIVGQAYYRFDYIRMWWPMQDYFNLTFERIRNAVLDPAWRSALFQVWLNRDYTQYAALVNRDMSLPNWQPSAQMRLYLRKDVAAQVWNYGVGPTTEELITDPYEGKEASLQADQVLGAAGLAPGQLQRPRDLAFAPDGSLYVVDTHNHRVQHLARDGSVLHVWGSFADIAKGPAPGGTFYEPWGIAVGPDGSIYVADTWNHRIQQFTASGEFVRLWGYFGQGETPIAFWGPRDVLVDPQGRVFVSDTGNKRIVIFDSEGKFLTQFGSAGFEAGQFNEPVGLALDSESRLYVADTWNQRIQVFSPTEAGSFEPTASWDVYAWYGQSLENKPYLAVSAQGRLYATDPEGYRILEFDLQGELVRYWGDYSLGVDGFGLAGSVAVDPAGGLWVSDTGNSRLLHFTPPG